MKKNFFLLCGLGLTAFQVSAAGLADCRAIADAQARLVCYDGLPLPAIAPAAPAVPVASVAVAATPAAAPAPAKEPAGGWFGLSRQSTETDKSVTSVIPGHFKGWGPGTRFRLANGQVWRVSDDSSAFYDLNDPKVTITPGILGSYYLKVEGVNDSPHVRRVE